MVIGNNSNNTNINADGLLIVASDETATSLTVEAISKLDPTKSGTNTIPVETPLTDKEAIKTKINGITPGSTDTVNIDGVLFYVTAKDTTNNRALLWTKDKQGENKPFGSSNKWEDSTIRTYLNGEWLNDKTILNTMLVETEIKTREAHDSENFTPTTNKVFLLSEADVFGTFNGETANVKPDDYTYNSDKLQLENQKEIGPYYWLRSPYYSTAVAVVDNNGNSFYEPMVSLLRHYRPRRRSCYPLLLVPCYRFCNRRNGYRPCRSFLHEERMKSRERQIIK